MHTKYLPIDDLQESEAAKYSCNGKHVHDFAEGGPGIRTAIFLHTFVIKAVDLQWLDNKPVTFVGFRGSRVGV
jgi:hypothetical protein